MRKFCHKKPNHNFYTYACKQQTISIFNIDGKGLRCNKYPYMYLLIFVKCHCIVRLYISQIDDEADEENVPNQNSVQFSLTPGSIDLTNNDEPIVIRNDVNSTMPVLIDGLASPDSVENEPTSVGNKY